MKAQLDQLAPREMQALKEVLVLQGLKDSEARQERQGLPELKEIKEMLEL
jgi:hypothetical protein